MCYKIATQSRPICRLGKVGSINKVKSKETPVGHELGYLRRDEPKESEQRNKRRRLTFPIPNRMGVYSSVNAKLVPSLQPASYSCFRLAGDRRLEIQEPGNLVSDQRDDSSLNVMMVLDEDSPNDFEVANKIFDIAQYSRGMVAENAFVIKDPRLEGAWFCCGRPIAVHEFHETLYKERWRERSGVVLDASDKSSNQRQEPRMHF
ncbi:hypothetical protein BKA70DRAFT_1223188 [Coprinopsis sp. MPI-PUGE-AT-0042]|nr:hypothetical protein BKA70DRAFT_1223188 [Coprinopsis sp. MPI-PUGE-AT-0042]